MFRRMIFVLLLFLLCGCWDQRLIADRVFIGGVGFDEVKNNETQLAVSILNANSKGNGTVEYSPIFHSESGKTMTEVYKKIEHYLPGSIDAAKVDVILFGPSFIHKDIYPFIQPFIINNLSSLTSKVIYSEKMTAKDITYLERIAEQPNAVVLEKIIKNAENNSVIPTMNTGKLIILMTEEGIDFTLPIIKIKEKKEASVIGAGLFHKSSYTGEYVPASESGLLTIMMSATQTNPLLSSILEDDEKIGYSVNRSKVKIDIEPKNLQTNIDIQLSVMLVDIPKRKILTPSYFKQLQPLIQKDLQKRMEKIIQQLQKNNSDLLGIGRMIREKNPEKWKSLKWEETYKKIKIKPTVHIKISESN